MTEVEQELLRWSSGVIRALHQVGVSLYDVSTTNVATGLFFTVKGTTGGRVVAQAFDSRAHQLEAIRARIEAPEELFVREKSDTD